MRVPKKSVELLLDEFNRHGISDLAISRNQSVRYQFTLKWRDLYCRLIAEAAR